MFEELMEASRAGHSEWDLEEGEGDRFTREHARLRKGSGGAWVSVAVQNGTSYAWGNG